METREYFEEVMQEFNQKRNGRTLRKYCIDEGIDYEWLKKYKSTYRSEKAGNTTSLRHVQESNASVTNEGELVALTLDESMSTEKSSMSNTWTVQHLTLKTPSGVELEIKCNSMLAVAELLHKMC